MITLHGYWRSSASWRVRIALAHKGLPYDNQPVHLVRDGGEQHSDDYRALSPLAQVPTLIIDDADAPGGTLQLTQSLAIIEYLDERFPDPPLLPASKAGRALARQHAEVINAGTQPLQNLYVLQRVKDALGCDSKAWAVHFITRGLTGLEALASRTAGDYLIGDAVSVADLCLIPQLYNARRFGIDLSAMPTLLRVEARCQALPAFIAAHPDQQPDAQAPA